MTLVRPDSTWYDGWHLGRYIRAPLIEDEVHTLSAVAQSSKRDLASLLIYRGHPVGVTPDSRSDVEAKG
jgi:hypothetical protein